MAFFAWLASDWIHVLTAIGVIAGLFYNAWTIRSETDTRRVANLLAITSNHREIWREYARRKNLHRVCKKEPNLSRKPVTAAEHEFVNSVILHLNSVYFASERQLLPTMEGIERDVRDFLGLPIPAQVWAESKIYQNRKFANFVDACLASERESSH
jgi:hypothetical protein